MRALAFVVAASLVVARPLVAQRVQVSQLITVIDSVTGLPVADVQIVDLRTRGSTLTTMTGTAAVTVLDSAGALLRCGKSATGQ